MAKYRVSGDLTVHGHKPGTVFEQDLPADQEARHLAAGYIEKVRADTKTTDEKEER